MTVAAVGAVGKLALTAHGTHVQVLPYYAPLHFLR